jgi:hypothetical protein
MTDTFSRALASIKYFFKSVNGKYMRLADVCVWQDSLPDFGLERIESSNIVCEELIKKIYARVNRAYTEMASDWINCQNYYESMRVQTQMNLAAHAAEYRRSLARINGDYYLINIIVAIYFCTIQCPCIGDRIPNFPGKQTDRSFYHLLHDEFIENQSPQKLQNLISYLELVDQMVYLFCETRDMLSDSVTYRKILFHGSII